MSVDDDPWQEKRNNGTVADSNNTGFSDAFVNDNNKDRTFEKLPDSAEYLSGLEAKLDRIRTQRLMFRKTTLWC